MQDYFGFVHRHTNLAGYYMFSSLLNVLFNAICVFATEFFDKYVDVFTVCSKWHFISVFDLAVIYSEHVL